MTEAAADGATPEPSAEAAPEPPPVESSEPAAPDPGDAALEGDEPTRWGILGAIIAVALVAHGLSAAFTHPIYADAVFWYFPIADSLAAGDLGGLDVAVPPGHPALIGLLRLIGIPMGLAGPLVGVVCGALLALPLHALGRRVGGERVGLCLAALGALHPFIVRFAGELKSEVPLALFLAFAVERAVAVVERPTPLRAVGFGALVGLSYLVKPEGWGLLPVTALFLGMNALCRREGRLLELGRAALAIAIAAAVFYVVALGNIANVYAKTGEWGLTNKGGIALTNRVLTDSPFPQSLTDDHTEVRLHAQIYRGEGIRETSLGAIVRRDPGGQGKRILGNLVEAWAALPEALAWFPLILAIPAFLAARRARARWRLELFAIFVVAAYLGAFSLFWFSRRMLVSIVPIALLWPALGLAAGVGWLAGRRPGLARLPGGPVAIVVVALALVALGSALRIGKKHDWHWLGGPGRDAGAWLRENAGEPIEPATAIMADPGDAAFWAGGRYVFFPTDDLEATLEYARHKGVRFIAVDVTDLKARLDLATELRERPRPGVTPIGSIDSGETTIWIFRVD